MAISRISETILERVKLEAQEIIKEAEGKALERMDQATRQQEARFEAAKAKQIREADGEAARIQAQASIKARQKLSIAKAQIIEDITEKIKDNLNKASGKDGAILNLIIEAFNELGSEKAILYVSARDKNSVQGLVKNEKKLTGKIIEVREYSCSGGVIVEDAEGNNRIDNTYEARIERLLPQILPQISKELFST